MLFVKTSSVIPAMLVVAGPSGVGKTTFLNQLARAELSADIKAGLPDGCEGWPVVAAWMLDKHLETRPPDDASAISLHYDLNNAVRCGAPTFADEPAAQIILRAREAVVVTIEAPRDRLVAQLAHRLRTITFPPRLAEDNAAFIERYAELGWLETQSRSWRDFLDQFSQSGRLVNSRFITPVGDVYNEHDRGWAFAEAEMCVA